MDPETDAVDAVRLIAQRGLPGLVVAGRDGGPPTVLPAWRVVRAIVPAYVLEGPSLAGTLDEAMCDRVAQRLRGKKVRDLIAGEAEIATVRADDTIVAVAAVMARAQSPLVAVLAGTELVGIITAARLLAAALNS